MDIFLDVFKILMRTVNRKWSRKLHLQIFKPAWIAHCIFRLDMGTIRRWKYVAQGSSWFIHDIVFGGGTSDVVDHETTYIGGPDDLDFFYPKVCFWLCYDGDIMDCNFKVNETACTPDTSFVILHDNDS